MRSWVVALALTVLPVVLAVIPVEAADRGALWGVVSHLCVTAKQTVGTSFPCLSVDISHGVDRGYAVLKAPLEASHIIVVPTQRITGIESPLLQQPDAPNYWLAAWGARDFVAEAVGHPLGWDDFGMAVNSVPGRSQDQLHIHVDCVSASVKKVLRLHYADISTSWARLPVLLRGHRYMALRLSAASLRRSDPFRLLTAWPDARRDMADATLAVIGVMSPEGEGGFVVLASHADPATQMGGASEELLDHACRTTVN